MNSVDEKVKENIKLALKLAYKSDRGVKDLNGDDADLVWSIIDGYYDCYYKKLEIPLQKKLFELGFHKKTLINI